MDPARGFRFLKKSGEELAFRRVFTCVEGTLVRVRPPSLGPQISGSLRFPVGLWHAGHMPRLRSLSSLQPAEIAA